MMVLAVNGRGSQDTKMSNLRNKMCMAGLMKAYQYALQIFGKVVLDRLLVLLNDTAFGLQAVA